MVHFSFKNSYQIFQDRSRVDVKIGQRRECTDIRWVGSDRRVGDPNTGMTKGNDPHGVQTEYVRMRENFQVEPSRGDIPTRWERGSEGSDYLSESVTKVREFGVTDKENRYRNVTQCYTQSQTTQNSKNLRRLLCHGQNPYGGSNPKLVYKDLRCSHVLGSQLSHRDLLFLHVLGVCFVYNKHRSYCPRNG